MVQTMRSLRTENDEGFSSNHKGTSIYRYDSKQNTSRYEIIDPGDANYIQEESFAMSASIERALKSLDMLGAEIKSPHKILDYMYRYPEVAELTLFAADLVTKRFGPDAKLSLGVYQDRGSQFENLVLYIRQRNYNSNIMSTINEIRNEYGALFPRARGMFLLTTDFRQPG